MCKVTDFKAFPIMFGAFDVLSLNGEGADTTVSDVCRVSVRVARTYVAEYVGESDEWEISAIYRGDSAACSLNSTYTVATVRRYFRTDSFDDFVTQITRFINRLNGTDIANRCGWLSLKTDTWEKSNTRAVLLTGYLVDEY